MKTTAKQYLKLENAYDYFNDKLFNGILPGCLITLQRKKDAKGYFHLEKFQGKHESKQIDEIALNPDLFGRSEKDILSTLVHEMCHQWDRRFGKESSRRTYHNKKWSNKMQEIGLMPSNTGEPGGKKTGEHMTHYVIENGKFENLVNELLNDYVIDWFSEDYNSIETYITLNQKRKPGEPFNLSNLDFVKVDGIIYSSGVAYVVKKIDRNSNLVYADPFYGTDKGDNNNTSVAVLKSTEHVKKKAKNKTTDVCPRCKIKVWGKPDLHLICGECYKKGDGTIFLNNI